MLMQKTLFNQAPVNHASLALPRGARMVKLEHTLGELNERLREIYFEIKGINNQLKFIKNEIKEG